MFKVDCAFKKWSITYNPDSASLSISGDRHPIGFTLELADLSI